MDNFGLHPNWKALSTVHIPYKVFLAEGSQPSKVIDEPHPKKHQIQNITGSQITEFYRTVIDSPSASKKVEKPGKNPPRFTTATKAKFDPNHFFRAAMNNNVRALENFDYKNNDINSKDRFDWTAPMMAACEGAEDALKCLQRLGADLQIGDKKGNTPLSLARRRGYENIAAIILADVPEPLEEVQKHASVKLQAFYCELCKRKFRETSRLVHETSTVHLFNRKAQRRKTSRFNIPKSNRGLKLMVKQGWNKESGLGPKQDGNLYPVKTVIRKQRTGLGTRQADPKITHFKPYDLAAIKYRAPPPAGKAPNQIRQEQRRDQRKERILRLELA